MPQQCAPKPAQKVDKKDKKDKKAPTPAPKQTKTADPLYIAPAEPPTRAYIPPPKILKFEYRKEDSEKYANIYSLLVAIDGVEEQASNGILTVTDRDTLIEELSDQFFRALRVVGFNEQNVRDFAEESRLKCPFALNCLYGQVRKQTDTHKNPIQLHAYKLGTNLTSLSDLCAFPDSTSGQYSHCLLEIKSSVKALSEHNQHYADLLGAIDHWIAVVRRADSLSDAEKHGVMELIARIRSV